MKPFRTGLLLAALVALFMGAGYLIAGPRGALLALILAAAMNLFAWYRSDRMVLRLHGAREVTIAKCPEFVGLVHTLARRAGLPAPRVYVIDSAHPNAFATGRDPHHAAIAVTTGLLGLLERDEIAGVVAHELGHIRNRDTALMTLVATLAGAVSMLASFGSIGRRAHPAAMLLAVLAAPVVAMIVQLAISRAREYGADRAGAEIARDPHALASALAKLSQAAETIPDPVSARVPAMAQLYIASPVRGLFSTHPAPDRRIALLRAMARPVARKSALDPLK